MAEAEKQLPTQGLYLTATDQGVCWACKGKKGHWREAGDDNMGIEQPRHYRPCTPCNDTGLPGEEQLRKAQLERQGFCATCGLIPGEHEGQDWPMGCLRAAIAEIHRLRARP